MTDPHLPASQTEAIPCEACGGAGTVPIGEHVVTRDMAIDAGEPSMEGMSAGIEFGPCDECGGSGLLASASQTEAIRAGWSDGRLYCYGGCGTIYRDFPRDMILPTALWNRIAVGAPFDETQQHIDREGRGGVLCPSCIIARLAALPDCTVIRADIERPSNRETEAIRASVSHEDAAYLRARLRQAADYHEGAAKHSVGCWHDDMAVTLRDAGDVYPRLIAERAALKCDVQNLLDTCVPKPELDALIAERDALREALKDYGQHKAECALSRAQVPSFGCMYPNYFKHYGGQCNEKRDVGTGRSWWHCMKRAGHSGPHHGSREKATDPENTWESGTCTCGLDAVLASTEATPHGR